MQRLPMKKYRKILLLHWEQDKPVATILYMIPQLGRTTVYNCLDRAKKAGLTVDKIKSMSDTELEQALYPAKPEANNKRPEPDYAYIHMELRKKGVKINTLWQEYQKTYPDGYSRSQFYAKYQTWRKKTIRTLPPQLQAWEC